MSTTACKKKKKKFYQSSVKIKRFGRRKEKWKWHFSFWLCHTEFNAVSILESNSVICFMLSIELYLCFTLLKTLFVISTATPDAGEDPKVTRAKFFIRDLFLVSNFFNLCFPTTLELYCSLQLSSYLSYHDLIHSPLKLWETREGIVTSSHSLSTLRFREVSHLTSGHIASKQEQHWDKPDPVICSIFQKGKSPSAECGTPALILGPLFNWGQVVSPQSPPPSLINKPCLSNWKWPTSLSPNLG